MKITSSKSIIINLALTESEAEWLMGFIQSHPEAAQEHSVEKGIRELLFTGLKRELYPDKVAYNVSTATK